MRGVGLILGLGSLFFLLKDFVVAPAQVAFLSAGLALGALLFALSWMPTPGERRAAEALQPVPTRRTPAFAPAPLRNRDRA